MSDKKFCDECGVETHLVPNYEQEFEEKEVEIPVPNPKNVNEQIKVKHKVKASKTVKMKRQNVHTGKMEEVDVPKVKYLQPKCIVVRLQVGLNEYVQRDFCEKCYKQHEDKIKSLWNHLEKIDPK